MTIPKKMRSPTAFFLTQTSPVSGVSVSWEKASEVLVEWRRVVVTFTIGDMRIVEFRRRGRVGAMLAFPSRLVVLVVGGGIVEEIKKNNERKGSMNDKL